ncbi:UDP-N-acetylmuramate dehydrogenase [Candidatus Gracilibacteria bacterium]|nr:UDP-N-acetylmuramate dehydrogenase [Candidatus Gracilibacteria bacterium]MCF7819758.1 UDP-N-acetylmuramate dehydrogenase [Candidatus Gracilibacteria bacterium]
MEILKNEPLSKHTFYGVGGLADELWKVDDAESFAEVWAETQAKKIPFLILGKGSNLLCSDAGFRGRVFSLEFKKITWNAPSLFRKEGAGGRFVTVEAGKPWQEFVEETNKKGYEDLCNLSGIPGNFGGFVRGNAGAFGLETGDFVQTVEFLDSNGKRKIFTKEQCEFGYRESIFKHHPEYCILRATLQLKQKAEPDQSLQKTRTLLADRWKKYPPGKSGGSFFKNPSPARGDVLSETEEPHEKLFAGKLLEEAGAKGDQIGHAQISERHANFIVNLEGKATQENILALARKWKQKVHEKFGITLEPEIMILDEYGKKIQV